MKDEGNKRRNADKLTFLRYSTGESGMIVGSFWWRPYIKILFCRYALSYWSSRSSSTSPVEIPENPGNLSEITGKFHGKSPSREISQKILGNFPTTTTHIIPPPVGVELQNQFSRNDILDIIHGFYPHPSYTQYSTVPVHCTVQHIVLTVQYSTVGYSIVQYIKVQHIVLTIDVWDMVGKLTFGKVPCTGIQ